MQSPCDECIIILLEVCCIHQSCSKVYLRLLASPTRGPGSSCQDSMHGIIAGNVQAYGGLGVCYCTGSLENVPVLGCSATLGFGPGVSVSLHANEWLMLKDIMK